MHVLLVEVAGGLADRHRVGCGCGCGGCGCGLCLGGKLAAHGLHQDRDARSELGLCDAGLLQAHGVHVLLMELAGRLSVGHGIILVALDACSGSCCGLLCHGLLVGCLLDRRLFVGYLLGNRLFVNGLLLSRLLVNRCLRLGIYRFGSRVCQLLLRCLEKRVVFLRMRELLVLKSGDLEVLYPQSLFHIVDKILGHFSGCHFSPYTQQTTKCPQQLVHFMSIQAIRKAE